MLNIFGSVFGICIQRIWKIVCDYSQGALPVTVSSVCCKQTNQTTVCKAGVDMNVNGNVGGIFIYICQENGLVGMFSFSE